MNKYTYGASCVVYMVCTGLEYIGILMELHAGVSRIFTEGKGTHLENSQGWHRWQNRGLDGKYIATKYATLSFGNT